MRPGSYTNFTLLQRLRLAPADPIAWAEFVKWYGQKIYVWCRAWGLQEADAQDVTQDVFLKLSGRMKDFAYDPSLSFRAWLKTVTLHAWQDHIQKHRRSGQATGSDFVLNQLAAIEAKDDLFQRMEDAAQQELLKEAAARVRLRVETRTWEAFQLLALQDRTGIEVAELLGMKVATVFVARSKVQRMLRDEIARLDRE
ncbi:RNA polymerase sigma factor [Schlesneria paludicola]|uniref:RNA polymerase sigma factor n=1 Tax=Schlesneria paludicola TaxID=360056 RepID=UPI00029A602E|nr:sigma-70 family RNA polymerase sigma factor [Schlesneria paludicola]